MPRTAHRATDVRRPPASGPEPTGADMAAEAARLPNALDALEAIVDAPSGGRLAFFFDYDGTLTPIVRHPDLAVLDPDMRVLLERLKGRWPVAILSGRGLDDVRDKVDVSGIWYAGSHGFDLAGPDGRRSVTEAAEPFVDRLAAAASDVEAAVAPLAGVWVERKRFAIAVHFREADPDVEGPVREAVTSARARHAGLRVKGGKKIAELQPDIDWHKGAALRQVAAALGLDLARDRVIYVGDDETDEDAFAAVGPGGAGILVRDAADDARRTRARYALDGVDEVRLFLAEVVLARSG